MITLGANLLIFTISKLFMLPTYWIYVFHNSLGLKGNQFPKQFAVQVQANLLALRWKWIFKNFMFKYLTRIVQTTFIYFRL